MKITKIDKQCCINVSVLSIVVTAAVSVPARRDMCVLQQQHGAVAARHQEGGQEERHARVVRGHPRGDVGHVAARAPPAPRAPAPHDLQLRPRYAHSHTLTRRSNLLTRRISTLVKSIL